MILWTSPCFCNSSCLYLFLEAAPPKKKRHWSHGAISGFRRSKRFFQASPVLQWDNESSVGFGVFALTWLPLPSAYHLIRVKVFPGDLRKPKSDAFFFRGKKNCFSMGTCTSTELGTQVFWPFLRPPKGHMADFYRIYPPSELLKHPSSSPLTQQLAPETPRVSTCTWRSNSKGTSRARFPKEPLEKWHLPEGNLILDRPTSGSHEGYHQNNIMPSALLAKPEMFEPFQLPAFEKKNLPLWGFPKKKSPPKW